MIVSPAPVSVTCIVFSLIICVTLRAFSVAASGKRTPGTRWLIVNESDRRMVEFSGTRISTGTGVRPERLRCACELRSACVGWFDSSSSYTVNIFVQGP